VNVSDTVTDIDLVGDLSIDVSDQLTVTEDITTQLTGDLLADVSEILNVSDVITDIETTTPVTDFDVDVSEQLDISDVVTAQLTGDLTANVSDQLNVSDVVTTELTGDLVLSVDDDLNVSDVVTAELLVNVPPFVAESGGLEVVNLETGDLTEFDSTFDDGLFELRVNYDAKRHGFYGLEHHYEGTVGRRCYGRKDFTPQASEVWFRGAIYLDSTFNTASYLTLTALNADAVLLSKFSYDFNFDSGNGRWIIFTSLTWTDDTTIRPYAGVYLFDNKTQIIERIIKMEIVSDSWMPWIPSPSISDDGRWVVYANSSESKGDGDFPCNLSGSDDVCYDIFIHDRISGSTERITHAYDGSPADGGSGRPTVSGDGRWVAFWSDAGNLVEGDLDMCPVCKSPTVRKPVLCLVFMYSCPGLPRPTMSFIKECEVWGARRKSEYVFIL